MRATRWLTLGLLMSWLANIAWAGPKTQPVDERTLHIGHALETTGVNFLLPTGTWNHVIFRDLNEHLVRFNRERNQIEPGHAQSWRYDEKTQQYWFTLRRGLTWSDGTPIRAQDYVRSWRYYAAPEERSRCGNVLKAVQYFDQIKAQQLPPEQLGVVALDDLTLRVTLSQPRALFLRFLSNSNCFLLPFHRRAQVDFASEWTDSQALVFNGPYRLYADIVPGQPVVLVRNARYWNHQRLFFEKIVWHAYAQQDTLMIQDLLEARLHIAYNMNGNPNVPWMMKHRPEWVKRHQAGNLEYLTIHRDRSPLSHQAALRQALSMAIDRKMLVNTLFNRQARSEALTLAPKHYYRTAPPMPEWHSWPIQRRREQAKSILAALGYNNSHPLILSFRMNSEKDRRRVASSIAAMWQTVGARTEIVLSDVSKHYQAINRGAFDIARAGWKDQTGSPRYFFRLLDPDSPLYSHSMKLPRQALALGEGAQTEAEQERVYHQIEAENQASVAVIPLYHIDDVSFVTPKLQGYNGEAWWLRDLQALRWREAHAPAQSLD